MTNVGTDQKRTYSLISGDSHVTEPGDLWTSRVSAKYRDRAPRIESFELGDAWVVDGIDTPFNFGYCACAGLRRENIPGGWMRFDDMRRGGYEAKVRLEEMDADHVDAEVLYPTPRLMQAAVSEDDPAFHLELVRAYNDWLSEYVEYAPDRFGGMALLPNRGADLAVEEVRRVVDRPGIRGALIGAYPNGSLDIEPEDDALWGFLAEAGIVLAVHGNLSNARPTPARSPLPAAGAGAAVMERILQLIFAGVFDRFPNLNVMLAEVDCGWIPYFKEQVTDTYYRLAPSASFDIERSPIEYIESNVHVTFITDNFGVANRRAIGVERILWSSDYPHTRSDWPTSWRAINASMNDVPSDERHAILAGNAMRLFGFGQR